MQILVKSRFPVARDSEDAYVVPVLVDIRSDGPTAPFEPNFNSAPDPEFSESETGKFLVGRLGFEKLFLGEAEEAGFSLALVCDAASAVWLKVMETLTKRGGQRFRRDLQLEGYVDDILFLHEVVLHPDIVDKVPLVDAAIRAASGPASLIVSNYAAGQAVPQLLDSEYRDLGFRKIANSDLVLRDNRLRYPFGDRHPMGYAVEFTASAQHEAWTLDRWQALDIDFPAR